MTSKIPMLKPSVELPIPEELLVETINKSKDWAIMHGAAMRSKENFNPDALQFAPFVLTPTSFPKSEFQKAIHLQTILNELMHWVAHDYEFLKETLANTIQVDKFTNQLFKVYTTIRDEGHTQVGKSLGLLRSDYMAHCFNGNAIKQVEINTVASSFGGISSHMKRLHSFVLRELGYPEKIDQLPDNEALTGLCSAMIEAWKIMGKQNACILFIVEDVTYNICDQRFHEFKIRELNPNVKVIRRTLTQVFKTGKLGLNNELFIDDNEVSVIYFRAGYEPGHYPTQDEWDARLLMERSMAIKCPSIQYHLAGTKKVQQALAKPGILSRFIDDPKKIELISEIFTGLFSLDNDEEGDKAMKMAMENPERFVLKPQREGGGNNVYGKDIAVALKEMPANERSAWILMERIFPPITQGYMIRPGNPVPPPIVDLVSELGIFGAVIGDQRTIIYNTQTGHMLRTKLATANEGGVAAGLGALDSPYLINECC